MTSTDDLDDVLRQVAEIARPHAADGRVADYIPALAAADAQGFAICLTGLDGDEHALGDVDVSFSIQSISKLFSLVLAMQLADAHGGVREHLWSRVGREPSGDPFNSLVQLEHERGVPRNPMINAGALVVDDVLVEHCDDPKQATLDLLERLCGETLSVDEQVLDSELETGHLNRAMASLLASYDNLRNPVDDVLDAYVFACAISMTSRQLSRSMRFLANGGVEPDSGTRVLSEEHARRVAAILLTCGTYDSAGEFAFTVGVPCKSGVSGGIVGLVPGRMGLCVWSPPLDDTGNSVAGRAALHELSRRLDLSVV